MYICIPYHHHSLAQCGVHYHHRWLGKKLEFSFVVFRHPFFHFSHYFLLLHVFVFVFVVAYAVSLCVHLLSLEDFSCCCSAAVFCCSVSIAFIGFSARINGYLSIWMSICLCACVRACVCEYAYPIFILSTLFFTTNLLTIIRSLTRLLALA